VRPRTRRIAFIKMQCAGNHFVVVDAEKAAALDWPRLARAACRHHFGVGADGLMVLDRSPGRGYRVRMFNPDGSEDTCGNGTLCVARLLWHEKRFEGKSLRLELLTGPVEVRRHADGPRQGAFSLRMGRPDFAPEAVPADADAEVVLKPIEVAGVRLRVSSVGVGTPHTVIFDEALPDDEAFERLAPEIEFHPLFPEQTSVSWAVAEGPGRVRVRVWERGGVGESLGCGTGACAVAAVGRRLGMLDAPVVVVSPGGELEVAFDKAGHAWLTGTPEGVFEGTIESPAGPAPSKGRSPTAPPDG